MNFLKVWIPSTILAFFITIFFIGLENDPSYIPSVRIDKKAPEFSLQTLKQNLSKSDNDDFLDPGYWRGQVWVLNVFASWCVACNIEHPILMKIAKDNPQIQLIGLAYKDNPKNTERWLKKNGDPYSEVLVDSNGTVAIDYGVYGVPETFIIDSDGIIRYKNVGPIQPSFFEDHLDPILKNNAQ
jgi:cytochrome c biogenesis protein CcmG/thiol:disulfide interchange protein DsbE